jgi:hypothetical protein
VHIVSEAVIRLRRAGRRDREWKRNGERFHARIAQQPVCQREAVRPTVVVPSTVIGDDFGRHRPCIGRAHVFRESDDGKHVVRALVEEPDRCPPVPGTVDECFHLPSRVRWCGAENVEPTLNVATRSDAADGASDEDLCKVTRVPKLGAAPVKFTVRMEPNRDKLIVRQPLKIHGH